MISKKYFIFATVIYYLVLGNVKLHKQEEEDFYKLLGVPRDATSKEIRKAFKRLAVVLHPDKNKEDKDAEAKFIKLTKAYEILKEPETRKRYDLYGDTGEDKKHNYHSYKYYTEEFGIYDDDPLVITLSRTDYEISVIDSSQAWFINFYSPHCHHCHQLAPTWRKLAESLEGVVRIGAVNCEEDWVLCHQLKITHYPTLLYYEKEANIMYDGMPYKGHRTLEDMEAYIVSQLNVDIIMINNDIWDDEKLRKQPWLLLFCPDDNVNCPERNTQIKLAASLEGLMLVGFIEDPKLCNRFTSNYKANPIALWQFHDDKNVENGFAEIQPVQGSDFREIVQNVLNLLPELQQLNDNMFSEIRNKLRLELENPWLLCFYMGTATELNLQLKRLPALLPNMNLGLIHCGKDAGLCTSLHVNHYPSWGVLKSGGAFEMHHGRNVLHEIVTFAKDSSKSTNLHALSPADFYNIIREGSGAWFIDWYAPWCPPCRKLMPEIRRASQHFSPNSIKFGTIDCTQHANLCSREGVRAYPTTVLYNGSKIQHFRGVLNEQGIVEFVEDMLNPKVIDLDSSSFVQLMRKPENEIWLVDYFAPWCNPCQLLAPQLRQLAKEMSDFNFVKIAQVDCETNSDLCAAQHVKAYPTIRLYPLGSKGLNSVAIYNGHRDAVSLKSWLTKFLPSPVENLNSKEFRKKILRKNYVMPWLIDFYAPWCHHCIHFEPHFITAAQRLENHVRIGKLDCEAERAFCRELRVTSYPTVILFLSPDDTREIPSQDPSEIVKLVKKYVAEMKQYIRDEL